jgi:nitrite reductase/ring-hydroxylating ferredoxin subunit
LNAQDFELLTRVGPDTPMGKLMRCYWHPVMKSDELIAGQRMVRLPFLGERFIAARAPDGTVSVIEHACPHRGVSLFLGRNEDGGIRCAYHGWKFDHAGHCVDIPNEKPDVAAILKRQVSTKRLHVRERYGVVWVFDGETPPDLPQFDFGGLPEERLEVGFLHYDCNWLQAMEGDLDPTHLDFLHLGGAGKERFEVGSVEYHRQLNRHPTCDVINTPYGALYSAYRTVDKGELNHRIAHFAFPAYTSVSSTALFPMRVRRWVPLSDEHCMQVILGEKVDFKAVDKEGKPLPDLTFKPRLKPNGLGWFDRFRSVQTEENDYLRDIDRQRHGGSYTGIECLAIQDQAVTESMGRIVDRAREHLGKSDAMISFTRLRLLRALKALRDENMPPPASQDPKLYRALRGGHFTLPPDQDWLEVFNAQRREWTGMDIGRLERLARPVESRAVQAEPV